MSRPFASTPPEATPDQKSAPVEPLSGRSLILARATWIVVAALTLSFFAAGIPSEFAMFRTVCQPACTTGQLSPTGLQALRDFGLSLDFYAAYAVGLNVIFAVVYVAVAAVIFWRKPDDRMALFVSVALLTFGTATFPGTINTLATEHSAWWWPVAFLNFLGAASFGLFLFLFPDGRFVPRWTRWVALVWIAWQLPKYWFPSWASSDLNSWPGWLAAAVWLVALGTVLYAQVYRYRRVSNAVQRQQIKWVVLGISAAILAWIGINVTLAAFAPAPTSPGTLATLLIGYALIYAAMLLIPLSIGVAILRRNLWDVDFIINRTLVYGALTASVVLLYVLVVGGLGVLLQVRGNLIISLLATGLAAVLFQPLRNRLQRGVNHLMHGERDEPYTVLSRLGERLESTLSPDAVLPTVVQTVKEALKLPYVAIELERDATFETAASAGEPAQDPQRLPLVYGGETVGRLILRPRPGDETFGPADQRLLEDLAHQIGVAAHTVRLTDEAVRLSADLQRSRERLVTTREEERRRLHRDLHDGLGPTLGSLALKLDVAGDLLERDPAAARTLLGGLKTQAQSAVADIRRLVYALRPPALDDLGLLGAIGESAAQYSTNGLRVSVEAPGRLPPLSAAVEVAAYRIVQEALTNVARHAKASKCVIHLALEEAEETLRLEIRDDGRGLPPERGRGVGVASMRERAAELGGECVVELFLAGGTRVRASLPYTPGAGAVDARHPDVAELSESGE
jgi:signal transduction histidine kinase